MKKLVGRMKMFPVRIMWIIRVVWQDKSDGYCRPGKVIEMAIGHVAMCTNNIRMCYNGI